MPIFAYRCQQCSHHFEFLVQGATLPECPECQGKDLEKQLTAFAVGHHERHAGGGQPGACGRCGDPRGPGSCSMG